jgi:hypothetical protein
MRALRTTLAIVALFALVWASMPAPGASAAPEAPSWSGLEQPVPAGASWPVGLGRIGDIEFQAPNRGLLITEGEPPSVPTGVWAYNGVEWHQLATVCGASDGRIAWAGPSEFWTVSNGRAGQANEISGNGTETAVPIEDNTLCHFAGGHLVASYAHPANESDSYQAMHAAACITPADCWFGGDPLPEPQVGSFHLHWNGSSLENAPYQGEGHAIEVMRALEGHLYESVRVARTDRTSGAASTPVVHRINPTGVSPAIQPEEGIFKEGLPLYEPGETPAALDYLHLSVADEVLWAAAGRSSQLTEGPTGQVTVAQDVKHSWTQLIGPEHPLPAILADEHEEAALLGGEARHAVVTAIAAEPGTHQAWIALAPPAGTGTDRRAVLIHVSAEGTVLGERTLPSAGEEEQGVGPKGTAARLACPAANDCWLTTTQGWLFHLAPGAERHLARDPGEREYFTELITYRPPDLGLPQVPPDAPPPDTSGLVEEPPSYGAFPEGPGVLESRVTLPLISHLRSRLVKGTTLELRFHLAVKARVRLIAKRRQGIVAATRERTFRAGTHSLMLALNPRRWPTKLTLKTHALAPLPTAPSASGEGAGITTVSTRFVAPRRGVLSRGLETLP